MCKKCLTNYLVAWTAAVAHTGARTVTHTGARTVASARTAARTIAHASSGTAARTIASAGTAAGSVASTGTTARSGSWSTWGSSCHLYIYIIKKNYTMFYFFLNNPILL